MSEFLEVYLRSYQRTTKASKEVIDQFPTSHLRSSLSNGMTPAEQFIDLGDTRLRVAACMNPQQITFSRPQPNLAPNPEIKEYLEKSSAAYLAVIKTVKTPELVRVPFGEFLYDFHEALWEIVAHDRFHWGQIASFAEAHSFEIPSLKAFYGIVPVKRCQLGDYSI